MTVGVNDNTERKFRSTVNKVIGKGKGTLGKAMTEAMEKWVKEKEQEEIRQRALKRLETGYSMGKILYKNRSELHER
ncbi:MAG: hypothetical protein AABW99_01350 [archaeon]